MPDYVLFSCPHPFSCLMHYLCTLFATCCIASRFHQHPCKCAAALLLGCPVASLSAGLPLPWRHLMGAASSAPAASHPAANATAAARAAVSVPGTAATVTATVTVTVRSTAGTEARSEAAEIAAAGTDPGTAVPGTAAVTAAGTAAMPKTAGHQPRGDPAAVAMQMRQHSRHRLSSNPRAGTAAAAGHGQTTADEQQHTTAGAAAGT